MNRLLPVDTTFAVDTRETYWQNGVKMTRKYAGRTDGQLLLSLDAERDEGDGSLPAPLSGLSVPLIESGTNTGVYTATLDGTTIIAALGSLPQGTRVYEYAGFGSNMNDGISRRVLIWSGL